MATDKPDETKEKVPDLGSGVRVTMSSGEHTHGLTLTFSPRDSIENRRAYLARVLRDVQRHVETGQADELLGAADVEGAGSDAG